MYSVVSIANNSRLSIWDLKRSHHKKRTVSMWRVASMLTWLMVMITAQDIYTSNHCVTCLKQIQCYLSVIVQENKEEVWVRHVPLNEKQHQMMCLAWIFHICLLTAPSHIQIKKAWNPVDRMDKATHSANGKVRSCKFKVYTDPIPFADFLLLLLSKIGLGGKY